MKKLNFKKNNDVLSRSQIKNIFGGTINYLAADEGNNSGVASYKCCLTSNMNSCGTCASSSGIPTCSAGYTLVEC